MSKDLDRLDAEHIEETQLSPGYAIISARIRDEIGRKIRTLIETGVEPEKTRGMIMGLELALEIPGIVKSQCRSIPERNGR